MSEMRTLHILVIDDDWRVRAALADTLRAAGHRVDVAASGEDGLLRFAERRYDVVLTDVMMPGIDGWEVARVVRHARPDVGVVLLSGMLSEGESAPAEHGVGAATLLAKPVTLDALQTAVERAVRHPATSRVVA
jgi:CheY-like chemotaxis protein